MQLYIICGLLTAGALGRIGYKTLVLGFSLLPGRDQPVWLVEAQVDFRAEGGPVKVLLSIPKQSPGYKILEESAAAVGYGYMIETSEGYRRAVWSARDVKGKQTLFYRVQVYDARGADVYEPGPAPPTPEIPTFESRLQPAARSLLQQATERSSDVLTFTSQILQMLNREISSDAVKILLSDKEYAKAPMRLAMDLLATKGIASRIARGVQLQDGKRRQPLEDLLDVYTKNGWTLFDPTTGQRGLPPKFVLWQQGGESLLDVEGGTRSSLSISVIRNVLPEKDLLQARTRSAQWGLGAFSIYNLPVSEQNIIKKLLLVPLGALIIVLMRNVVGLTTSGTFMPVLIALAFMETKLLTGIVVFVVILVVGLMIRSHLSKLNLLLVPRISAGVIVVILVMTSMSILSYRVGLPAGMSVTFFPMIIIAWTIERMSITAEESGSLEAIKQVASSLFTAVLIYLAISNRYAEHLTFAFPEVTLIFLSAVLLLGTYTGYRLLELRRFDPLARQP